MSVECALENKLELGEVNPEAIDLLVLQFKCPDHGVGGE
jgi:hypothetical protein